MGLIVEDGTGKDDADSYVSVREFDQWCEARNLTDLIDRDNAEKEGAARTATEFADTSRRYKGRAASGDQALMFPRIELRDWSDYPVTGVPKRMKNAVCFLMATVLQGEPLYENLKGEVLSESIGPISTTYAPGSNRHREFPAADRLLAQYVRDPSRPQPMPSVPEAASTSFAIGMHDMPGEDGGL